MSHYHIMKKTKRLALTLLVTLTGFGTINNAYALQDCRAEGNQKHSTMTSQISLKLTGSIKQHQEVGRFSFIREGGVGGVAECGPDAGIHGYTSYSEGSGISAKYYADIDGYPAYHIYPGGDRNFVYVLLDSRTGIPFQNHPGADVPVPEGSLLPLDLAVIIYAAKDNPDTLNLSGGAYIGTVLIQAFNPGGGTTSVGYSYRLKGKIENAPSSCNLENSNLEFTLPRAPTSAFSSVGFPDGTYTAEDELFISCNDNVSANMKLIATDTESYNGKDSVIKIDNEGQGNNAAGIGFTIKSPMNNDEMLVNHEFIKIADLQEGRTRVPLIAEYYRYGDSIKAGKAEATAQFVLQFD
ncbi:MAG: fimbrial protein [Morganella sp. (in: enterobacteria)]